MEEVKSNSGQNLGIAALITGIIAFVIAVIPCIGIFAIIPGIVSVVLASIGLSQSSKSNSPRGVVIAGLVIGVVALMISLTQIVVAGKIAEGPGKWPHEIQTIIDEVKDDVMRDLKNSDISIKIESNGDTIMINTSPDKADRQKQLEELEEDWSEKTDTVEKK